MDAAAALLGLACATKQLAWPFAPFLLAHFSGARTLGTLAAAPSRRKLVRAAAITAVVFLVVVAPIAALDFRAFWGDIVRYNAGLPGGDNYPLGGTPGLGFANFLVYFGAVGSLREHGEGIGRCGAAFLQGDLDGVHGDSEGSAIEGGACRPRGGGRHPPPWRRHSARGVRTT
jgi:hypothetical protein